MTSTPKTIQIYLPGGDTQGIRIAEITTRIVQVMEVPRPLLAEFFAMPESQQVGLYFLISKSDDGSEALVYVGQTGDLRSRLASHHREKDFWQRALVLISRTQSLTQTHAVFLEWHSLQAIRKAGRYSDVNGNAASQPYTPAPLKADCLEIFETGRTLLATLGYPIFDPLHLAPPVEHSSAPEELFYCNASGANGRGIYGPEGFVVLEGSSGRRESVASFASLPQSRMRLKLIETGVLKEVGDTVVFTKDHLFSSPSSAAQALLGRSANGWTEWKSADGKTLDALKRQSNV